MATALDIGLFDYFGVIFPFILTIVVVYALLQFTKFLGENKALHMMIAFSMAAMLMVAPKAIMLIKFITPWFTLLFIFLVLMLMLFKLMGASDKDISTALMGGKHGEDKTIPYWIIIISVLILVIGLGAVYGDTLSPVTADAGTDPDGFSQEAWAAFFHPKVVGLIFISLVGVFTIKFMAGDVRPKKR